MAYGRRPLEIVDLELNRAQGNSGKPTATTRNQLRVGAQPRLGFMPSPTSF